MQLKETIHFVFFEKICADIKINNGIVSMGKYQDFPYFQRGFIAWKDNWNLSFYNFLGAPFLSLKKERTFSDVHWKSIWRIVRVDCVIEALLLLRTQGIHKIWSVMVFRRGSSCWIREGIWLSEKTFLHFWYADLMLSERVNFTSEIEI